MLVVPKEAIRSPGAGATRYECWELNLEQLRLVTAKPYLLLPETMFKTATSVVL